MFHSTDRFNTLKLTPNYRANSSDGLSSGLSVQQHASTMHNNSRSSQLDLRQMSNNSNNISSSTKGIMAFSQLPPTGPSSTSTISQKLKNSMIIQKEADMNKENMFRLKERVEEVQKRMESISSSSCERNSILFQQPQQQYQQQLPVRDFKQSYVLSRTSNASAMMRDSSQSMYCADTQSSCSSSSSCNPKTEFDYLRVLSTKMDAFKQLSRDGITRELKSIAMKVNENRGCIYDFFAEENKIALKYLVSLLYDELIHAHSENVQYISQIAQLNSRIVQLQEESLQQHFQINSLNQRLSNSVNVMANSTIDKPTNRLQLFFEEGEDRKSIVVQHHRRNSASTSNLSSMGNSGIYTKGGRVKLRDIRSQIEALEGEYRDLENIQESLEEQVARYKHCFTEQLKLCQLLQKSMVSLEEENKALLLSGNTNTATNSSSGNSHNRFSMERVAFDQTNNNNIAKFEECITQLRRELSTALERIERFEASSSTDKNTISQLEETNKGFVRELQDAKQEIHRQSSELNAQLEIVQEKEGICVELTRKHAQLENQVYLCQREIEVRTDELKKVQCMFDDAEKHGAKEATRNVLDSQMRVIPQLEFLLFEEHINEEIQRDTKQLILQLFGSSFLGFFEKIQEKLVADSMQAASLFAKLQNQCNARIQGCEDLKVMGAMILQASEVLSRHSQVQLPTPLMMLREELEIKRVAITEKLADCTYEQQLVCDEFNDIERGMALMMALNGSEQNADDSTIQQQSQQQLYSQVNSCVNTSRMSQLMTMPRRFSASATNGVCGGGEPSAMYNVSVFGGGGETPAAQQQNQMKSSAFGMGSISDENNISNSNYRHYESAQFSSQKHTFAANTHQQQQKLQSNSSAQSAKHPKQILQQQQQRTSFRVPSLADAEEFSSVSSVKQSEPTVMTTMAMAMQGTTSDSQHDDLLQMLLSQASSIEQLLLSGQVE